MVSEHEAKQYESRHGGTLARAEAMSQAQKVAANASVGKQADNPIQSKPFDDDKPGKHFYLCPRAPSLLLKLAETEYVQAQDGALELTAEQGELLEALMKNRPDIKSMVQKVDMKEAKAVVEKHKMEQQQQMVQGALTSQNDAADKIRAAKQEQDRDVLTRQTPPTPSTPSPAQPKK